MDGSEFIKLAGMTVGYGRAGARSATSRAYYGAFHLAIDLLENLGCAVPRHGKAHALVPEFLRCSSNSDAREAGHLLAHLHSRRLAADYDLAKAIPEHRTFGQQSVESAHAIRELLHEFRDASDADEMVRDELLAGVAKVCEIRKLTL